MTDTPPSGTRYIPGWTSPIEWIRYAGAVRVSSTNSAPSRLACSARPRISVPLTNSRSVAMGPPRMGAAGRLWGSRPAAGSSGSDRGSRRLRVGRGHDGRSELRGRGEALAIGDGPDDDRSEEI